MSDIFESDIDSENINLSALEDSEAEEKWNMAGETAYHIALDALKTILWELDWH